MSTDFLNLDWSNPSGTTLFFALVNLACLFMLFVFSKRSSENIKQLYIAFRSARSFQKSAALLKITYELILLIVCSGTFIVLAHLLVGSYTDDIAHNQMYMMAAAAGSAIYISFKCYSASPAE
jgi:hypothetical protein